MIRFIHCADIHLDSPLRGLSRYEGAPVERLRMATRDAFTALVSRCLEEKVDFLLIAGDLYDGDWRDFNTGIYFLRQMQRLREGGIPVFVLHGNHDAESQMTRALELPDNVSVFPSERPTTFTLDALEVALHGQSFARPDTTENLALNYPPGKPGYLNIGLLHTALEGDAAHARYAPCSVAELRARGYDYWALGHVHQFQVIDREPWVVFSGNLQGRHIREAGPKGALLVEAQGQEIVGLRQLYTDVLRWATVEVDLSAARSLLDAIPVVRRTLEEVVNRNGRLAGDEANRAGAEGENIAQEAERLIAVRLLLHGRSPAHRQLLREEERLNAEIRALSLEMGADRLWIEQVRLRTSPPEDQEALRQRTDALGELALLLEEAGNDEELIARLDETLSPLASRLPASLRDSLDEGALQLLCQGELSRLVSAETPGLLARLAAESDE